MISLLNVYFVLYNLCCIRRNISTFLLLTVSAKVYYEQYFKSLFFFLISVAIIYPQISLLLKLYMLVQETVLKLKNE